MSQAQFTRADYEEAAAYIRARIHIMPQIGMVLGSGLGMLAEEVVDAVIIPYEGIPHFPRPSVEGHHGRLVIGTLESQPILIMQGRIHYYEGFSMAQVTFPVRVMQMLGINTFIVTNAAGGLNPHFSAGDLMLITDHINLFGHMGLNPLVGPNDESLGPRFPIFTRAYDSALGKKVEEIARQENILLRKGVYIHLAGPAFETPAEIRMFRAWGADAVGMSTVPEVAVARHGGMRVLGISSITNISIDNPDSTQLVSHEEVLMVGRKIVPNLLALLRGLLRELPPFEG